MITRRHFLGRTALLAATALAGRALADPTDAGNRMLFGYPYGAVGSKLASALLPLLAAEGGPSYHLVNQEGRNTRLASETAAHATPDGSTLLQAISSSLTLVASIYKDVKFDPVHDFTPLACVGESPYALAVGSIVPRSVTDLKGYLDWVEQNPDFRTIGVSVYGTVGHLAVRTLAVDTGTTLRAQPYQGTVPMMTDLRNQQLAAGILAPGSGAGIGPQADIRSIGVTSRQRLFAWPDQPTLAEQGASNMDFINWFAWYTQAAVPAAKLQALHQAIARMQASPAYDTTLKNLLLAPASLSPEQITARLRDETARYKALVQSFNITRFD
ncbi:tripartite tricarboxylate transporter substrate binding protein [Pseudomonas sp. dw_358]|uniref:Bug family tripartite tricarboxylate transporter substrate binding protein n=1 Tax=Pseudomonas sp. dw_358 TaxID=2720083 RepID=UPI001BD20C90|nr:tripartite tricarboxylate transporter substrate binding protein [Pseudomonas sp. dw_358]